MSIHHTAGGWHDLARLADALEHANDIAAQVSHAHHSKVTQRAWGIGSQALAAYASTIRQAAREDHAAHYAARLAGMDPDKRAEHANDARAEALADEWDADTGRAS